jgi:hypothetical protein
LPAVQAALEVHGFAEYAIDVVVVPFAIQVAESAEQVAEVESVGEVGVQAVVGALAQYLFVVS